MEQSEQLHRKREILLAMGRINRYGQHTGSSNDSLDEPPKTSFTVAANRCDVNSDRSVNILDIQLLINRILGIPGSPVDGDLNRDGNTNVQDLQLLVNVILGFAGCPGSPVSSSLYTSSL